MSLYKCYFGFLPLLLISCCFNTAKAEENCRCGWKNPTKIVGGGDTDPNEYTMMAGIFDVTEKLIVCGATIITPKHALTAASCLDNVKDAESLNNLGIIVGEHDTATGSDTNVTMVYEITSYDKYPSYTISDTLIFDDIAVLTINPRTFKFSNEIGPVCLPFHHKDYNFDDSEVAVLGWGLLEYGGSKPNTLQKATLRVTNSTFCKNTFPTLNDDKQICTFERKKDSCQLDGGGPILWEDPETRRLVLIGIIGGRVGCGSRYPSVNTRVSSYLDWISNVTEGETMCHNE